MAQFASTVTEKVNIVSNPAIDTVFFEDDNLAYNWKTNQWTRQPAWASIRYYPINTEAANIGLIRFSSNVADLQHGGFISGSTSAQDATITTGATDPNQGGRAVVNGVRPLLSEITATSITVRVGTQDYPGTTISWSTSTSLNSRTKMANFRSEGRWVRTELTVTGGFETIWGADVDFVEQGRV